MTISAVEGGCAAATEALSAKVSNIFFKAGPRSARKRRPHYASSQELADEVAIRHP
jgi:hypothetical protein